MSEIVEVWHEEPFTNSIAVAEGTEIQHKNVIELVRKHADSLMEFGSLAFETRKCGDSAFETRNSQGRPTEVALLNEPQATLLLTFMRNSETVIRFKVALVRAFFDLRAQLARSQPHATLSHNPAHAADQFVAADRSFRAALRSARAAGLRTPRALVLAREVALAKSGLDMFAELAITPEDVVQSEAPAQSAAPQDPMVVALSGWVAQSVPWQRYKLADIVGQALGLSPSHPGHRCALLKAGPVLRALGMKSGLRRDAAGVKQRWWWLET